MPKKKIWVGGGSGRGGFEPRIEVIVKMQKRQVESGRGGGGVVVRMNVYQELKEL